MWQAAELYESQGLYDHAVQTYQSILSVEPENRKAQAKVVQIQFTQRIGDADSHRGSAADELPPQAVEDLGLAYMGMGLYLEALEEFETAIQSVPSMRRRLLRHVITCLLHLDREREAHQTLQMLLDDPERTLSEKGEIIAETVATYREVGLLERAHGILQDLPKEQKDQIPEYQKTLDEVVAWVRALERASSRTEQTPSRGVLSGPGLDESSVSRASRLTAHTGVSEAQDQQVAIPLTSEVTYSTDNKNWYEGRVTQLAADWALLHVGRPVESGDTLVLGIYLPTRDPEPVLVIGKVLKVRLDEEDDFGVQARVRFESFLPGGESLLKGFIDQVARDPSLLTRPESAEMQQPESRRSGGRIVDSVQIRAIRDKGASTPPEADRAPVEEPSDDLLDLDELEVDETFDFNSQQVPEFPPDDTVLLHDNEILEVVTQTDAYRSAPSPETNRRRAEKFVKFACSCGQVHNLPREKIGRSGKCNQCGRLLTVPETDRRTDSLTEQVIGTTVGGSRILYRLGGGGMGGVFRGHHLALDIPVAVKILYSHLAEKDPIFIKRFIREARATAKLQHPNIVGVMNVGYENGLYYLIMPFVGGGSAAALIARHGRLPAEKALDIALQIAWALSMAEEHNMLHRDIKPANILFTERGEAKLADLGLAKNYSETQDSSITQTGITCGTPLYFSPEQARGAKNLDIRSDIYSLGITMYHLLDGSPPFTGESAYVVYQKHAKEELPPFRAAVQPPVPESVFRLIKKMAAKDPDDRFPNTQALIDEMERVLDEVLAAGTKDPGPQPSSRRTLLERLGIKRGRQHM
ncbi:MAG: protein kinase [Thermodesulfobacteriota bacterium]